MRVLERCTNLIRREDGFALIDSMIGVIAMAVIVTMLVSTSVAASVAMTGAASQAERQMYLRSLVNELASNPDIVPTAGQSNSVQFANQTALVSSVRVDDGVDRTVIRAAVNANDSTDCTAALNPAANTKVNPTCLVAEVSVDRRVLGPAFTPLDSTYDQAGVDSAAGVPVTAGTMATFIAETGVTSVKWIAGVKATGGAARVSLYQSGVRIGVSAFSAGADTYLFGTVPVASVQPVTVVWEGKPGVAHNVLVYKTGP